MLEQGTRKSHHACEAGLGDPVYAHHSSLLTGSHPHTSEVPVKGEGEHLRGQRAGRVL